VYFLKRKISPVINEAPQGKNVGGNEGIAPRILNLDNMVQPLESNGQQAGYNPQQFGAPSTVACLCVLQMKVLFWFLSTYSRRSSALSLVGAQNMFHLFGLF
jgi:hypothetical protein